MELSTTALPAFTCICTPNFPSILNELGCTLVISTYQAGKIVMISPNGDQGLMHLTRDFKRPMGVAIKKDWMAIATANEVVVLRDSPDLARTFPDSPNTYDHFYLPRATYYTGHLDVHDVHFGKNNQIWAINTSHSCLCNIDIDYSFRVRWQPHFISALGHEDRCHLNGLAMLDDEPIYVSALGSGDKPGSWRENITKGGVIVHIPSNETVISGLAMPHTPRIYDGKLYCLLSAAQELICVDIDKGTYETVAAIPGFVRGMDRIGDYLFIATSKLRKESSTFKHLEIAKVADKASIIILHLPTGKMIASLDYQKSLEEIYDIHILPNCIRPNLFNTYGDHHNRGLHLQGATAWAIKAEKDIVGKKISS